MITIKIKSSSAKHPSLNRGELKRIGGILWDAFAYVPETGQNGWEELEHRYWSLFIRYFGEELADAQPADFIQLTNKFIRPMDGMTPLLEEILSQGAVLAICSNNNEFWFRRQMDNLKLHRFFIPSNAILSCRIGVSKSSERFEMFHVAAGTLGIPKAQCVFVDDRRPNVTKAQECGMVGIHFQGAEHLRASLQELGLLATS